MNLYLIIAIIILVITISYSIYAIINYASSKNEKIPKKYKTFHLISMILSIVNTIIVCYLTFKLFQSVKLINQTKKLIQSTLTESILYILKSLNETN